MFERLKGLLGLDEVGARAPGDPDDPESKVRLATAALMVEAARMDGRLEGVERERIERLLAERFGLRDGELEALMEAAEAASSGAVDWQGFTRELNRALDEGEKIRVIEMMWEVALADGELHDLEASLLRRLGGLLYVPDRERGEAKKRAMAKLGLTGSA